jgi:hypothetical protein
MASLQAESAAAPGLKPAEMKPPLKPRQENHVLSPSRLQQWLASRQTRFALLAIAMFFSLPAGLTMPDVGLDPSWQLSLQLANIQSKTFGREFVFTYGPLGYLLIHTATNKFVLLLFDCFILGSLLAIYGSLLPPRPMPLDALLLLALAAVTKTCWGAGSAAILFTILIYWLWRVLERGNLSALAGAMAAALVVFFGKVNYGLLMVILIPAYGAGLLTLHKNRFRQGMLLLLGFPVLVCLGALVWQVDLSGYLRAGRELVVGYNEAMFAYPAKPHLGFELACALLLAMGITAGCGQRRLAGREQAMFLPLVLLAALLLFKNAFTRSDFEHNHLFYAALPLLLVVWWIVWRGAAVKTLLIASLCYPLAQLTAQTTNFGLAELIACTPLHYCQQLTAAPWREDAEHLQAALHLRHPEAALPAEVRSRIGRASVDVMPWESSVAVLNGLNYRARPIPQSYSAYTPWLDGLNARFLDSTNAPAYVIYACAQDAAIDGRPAAWDESLTKMALMENYVVDTEFSLPMRVWPYQNLEPASVFLLKHGRRWRRLVPVATNAVSVALGESLPIPATTNLVFLTLEVQRTMLGKLAAAALSPGMLIACFEYQDAPPDYYRAVLPILQTGVLVNWRVESAPEIRNWLETAITRNPAVSSLAFKTHDAWAFKTPLNGFLVEYRLEEPGPPVAGDN